MQKSSRSATLYIFTKFFFFNEIECFCFDSVTSRSPKVAAGSADEKAFLKDKKQSSDVKMVKADFNNSETMRSSKSKEEK